MQAQTLAQSSSSASSAAAPGSAQQSQSQSQTRRAQAQGERRYVGGSIVLLRDAQTGSEQEQKDGEYIELDKSLWPADVPAEQTAGAAGAAAGGVAAGGDTEMADAAAEDDGEAEMPEPFEYPFTD